MVRRLCCLVLLIGCFLQPALGAERPSFSGIYPHLAYYNLEGECGTGAVVPWAGKLWVITYGPHNTTRSSDKLYEIDNALNIVTRPESVGGTNANRLIHRESDQLFIGPYAIDGAGAVRVIPRNEMKGRLTGTARHLTDPTGKVYFATMEEGVYEVDVKTLAVTELFPDGNFVKGAKNHAGTLLPGYHGKGLYSGQGRLVYANNGEVSAAALRDPATESGVLAEWDGQDWTVVRRNQFTDVRGPGGVYGNDNPATDPLWSIGWDHRSLILMLLDEGKWHAYRLPKASHSYDGAHGWNTEWPRIGDIGEDDWLMTMHGSFWRFPPKFSAKNGAGIAPRSNYLKVVGDFTRWNDQIVLGCDDAAKSEFLNRRNLKGSIAGPGRSNSNLWFLKPEQLDSFGPPIGRGGVWVNDPVQANTPSDPFLLGGFESRLIYLAHQGDEEVEFTLELDREGKGTWTKFASVKVPAQESVLYDVDASVRGAWIRAVSDKTIPQATVWFNCSNTDKRDHQAAPLFDGVAQLNDKNWSGGLVRVRDNDPLTLQFAATEVKDGATAGEAYYEMNADMQLRKVEDAAAQTWLQENAAVAPPKLTADECSALYIDPRSGRRFRLPKGNAALVDESPLPLRIAGEAATERDLLNAYGSFYELPAENAGGFAKLRAVATHGRRVADFCSWRGLLVMSGVTVDPTRDNRHIITSDDGRVALWVGALDDLWQFGRPTGEGGPWKNTAVKAGEPSDSYLMSGYYSKQLDLSHDAPEPVKMLVEFDITGEEDWVTYDVVEVPPGTTATLAFNFAALPYWGRVTADRDCQATAWFRYE